MSLKTQLLIVYFVISLMICGWFATAAANGWKAPNFGFLDGAASPSGRSYGGSWGGGK